MAFNKAKALKEAGKFVLQGRIGQAIKQYFEILDKDPTEVVLLNTIGDLYIRDKNVPEGLRQFYKLAEAYVQEEFPVKAIAIYRKIAKLDPNSVDPLVKLAELYQIQRLGREAREVYYQVAAYYQQKNLKDKALEILRKTVQLDVENATARARLATLCEEIGRKEEAGQVYLETAQLALRRGDTAAARIALNKAQELAPENSEVYLLRAREALASKHPEEVEAILSAFPGLKEDPAGRALLIESYLSAQQLKEAQKLIVDLFRADPADFSPVASFVSVCVQAHEFDTAFETLSELADELIEQRKTSSLAESLRLICSKAPQHIPTLELMYRICEEMRDEFTLLEILQRVGHAYLQCGQVEKAEAAFQELVRREPKNEQYTALLKQVLRKQGKELESKQVAARSAAATARAPDEGATAPAASAAQGAEREAVVRGAIENSELFARYHLLEKAVAELDRVLELYPDEIEIHQRLVAMCSNSMSDRAKQAAQALERIYTQRGDVAGAKRYAQMAAGQETPFEGADALQAVPAPAMTPESSPPFLAQPAAGGPGEIELASDFSLSPGEKARTAPTRRVPATASAESTPGLPFPGEQDAPVPMPGKTPFTVSAPPAVGLPTATAADSPPDLSNPPSALSWESEEIDLSEDWESLQAQNASASLQPETPQKAAAFNYEDSRIEINFYLENGFVDEAKKILEELSRKLRGDPRIEDLRGLIEAHTGRLATEVNAAPELKVQPTATPVAGPASPLSGLLEEIGEAPGMGPVQQDDAEAHYNLGVAFREMNLLDEAIGEFQKVVKGAGKGENAPNFLQACSLLALCFMKKGMATVAVKWYRRALETPGLDEEAILALQYDLGVAYEEAGDVRAAVEKFTEVYGQNIDFRDVAEKIRILRTKVS